MFELAAMIPVALLSVPHCAAMCGPLAACATRCDRRRQLGYQSGRLLTYTLAGAAAGGLGRGLGAWIPAPWVTASASWLVALALIGAALSTVIGPRRSTELIAIGPRRPRLSRWLPRGPSALFGGLTVFLPCGALWAALAIATATGSLAGGAAAMLVFALVTGAAVSAAAAICARLRRARWLFSAALITGAVLLAIAPAFQLASREPEPSCPLHDSP